MLDMLPEILEKALVVIGAASTVATVTTTKKDDTALGYLSAIVHFLAMNFGKANNKG